MELRRMELEQHVAVPEHLHPQSRVWIFQSSRPFNEQEEKEIDEQLYQFYVQWKSHGKTVTGWAKLVFRYFVVVVADETQTGVGGCSTDAMTRIIKSLERQYSVNFFDRLTLTFLVDDKPQPLPMQQVSYALQQGFIETDSLLFNNLVDTKEKLLREWLVPLNQSWLWARLNP
jgi:hypothetical protein